MPLAPGSRVGPHDVVAASRPVTADGGQSGGRGIERALRVAAATLAVGLVILTLARVARSWPREAHLGYAEGIWIGLANDAAHGVLYRPLDGPLGYGGTRYFPLFFTLHGGLVRAGVPPIDAGYALSAISVVLLAGGVVVFLRRAGAGPAIALAAAAVALSCQPAQMALLAIRGDALAAAFVMLGLSACLPGGRLRAAPWWFALAFAVKATSLYGAAAGVIALATNGRGADARRLTWQTLAGLVAVLAVMAGASGGRVAGVFAASAAGGAGLWSLLAAPLSFARILRRVPESAFFVQIAAASLLAGLRWRMPLERVAFLACAATSVAIYASPATIENHLIDLTVLAVTVLAGWAAREARWTRLVLAVMLVGGLAAAASAAWRFQGQDRVDHRSSRREVASALAGAKGPILFEQPMLAAARGESPYILDPYILSVRVARDPAAVNRLVADVEEGRFGAVVLEAATLELAFADTLTGGAAARFRGALERRYRLEAVVGGRPVYRPK